MKMAASSERSPPPFPESEEQELEFEDDDSDEGVDIFTGTTIADSKMDPPLPVSTNKPPNDIFNEPPEDPFGDPLSDAIKKPENDITIKKESETASNPLADSSEADMEKPAATLLDEPLMTGTDESLIDLSNTPDAALDLLNEPLIDTSEEPPKSDITSEPVGDIISSDPLSDIIGDPVSDTITSESESGIVTSDPVSDILSEPVSDILTSDPLGDIISEPLGDVKPVGDIETSEPASDLLTSEPASDLLTSEPVSNILTSGPAGDITNVPADDMVTSESMNDILNDEPMNDIITSEPASDIITSEPASDIITSEPASDIISSEPASDIISSEPASDIITCEPASDITTSEPASDITSEPGSDIVTSEPGSDIITSESASDIITSEPASDIITSEPASDIIITSEPASDIIITSEPASDIIITSEPAITNEALADTIGEPLTQAISKDPPSEPLGITKSKPATDLFGDSPDDDDLFKEPLGAMVKKPQSTVFSDPVDIFAEAKSSAVSEPLGEQSNDAPTDIFTEEAITTVTSTGAKPSTDTGSKTNGVHSDEEEQDIFAEATVELSLDSPRNDRKKKDVAKPAASAPSISVTPSAPKPQPKTMEELEEEESEDKFELNISVTNPEKVGDGMNAYMAYKVSTQTTMPMFRNKTFTVRRRFSDFLGLYEKLSEKHSQSGYIVPPPPEKSILGMTKVKVGKEDPSSAEFVERRRAALERYLQRVLCHPSLLQDPDVREFLEREELPRAVSTQALSGAGFLKMLNKATEAVSKMTIKMNESDIWFEEKLQEVESEDQQLRKLHAMVDSLVNHRKELSGNTAVFAKSVAMLGSSEDNTALSRALSQLAEVEDKIEQLHADQAANDFFIFAELLADYIRLLGAVRGSFDHRMKAWQRWQDAQNMLQKKRETEAKLLWANKPDKLQQAKDDIAEWEAKVTQYERDFERVSATVRKEVIRFEKEKARDFKKQIVKYLESLLHSQQQLIKYWEAFLPEAKAIA